MIYLTDLNKKKIDLVCRKLDDLSNIGNQILEKVEDKTQNIDLLIYRDFFERFIFCLDAIRSILPNYEYNTYSKDYSLALLLRTSLLDFMTILYLMTFLDKDSNVNVSKNYKTELGRLLTGHIKRILERVIGDRQYKQIDNEEYKRIINYYHSNFSFLFENDTFDINVPLQSLKFKSEIRNKEIFKRLEKHPDRNINYYSRAIGLYDVYSKYEHYGVASRSFQRVDVNERFRNISLSIELIVEGIVKAFNFFKGIDNFDTEEKNLLLKCGNIKGILLKYN